MSRDGELIEFDDEYDEQAQIMRGHCTHEVFCKALAYRGDTLPAESRHAWARWVPAPRYSFEDSMILISTEQRRGCFPVTIDAATYDWHLREEERARAIAAVEEVTK